MRVGGEGWRRETQREGRTDDQARERGRDGEDLEEESNGCGSESVSGLRVVETVV